MFSRKFVQHKNGAHQMSCPMYALPAGCHTLVMPLSSEFGGGIIPAACVPPSVNRLRLGHRRALTDGYADTPTGPSSADGPTCCSANNRDRQKSS